MRKGHLTIRRLCSTVAIGIGLFSAAALSADGVAPGDVDPDAKWVVHVDVEKFRASRSLMQLLEDGGPLNHIARQISHLHESSGRDPLAILDSVTLYGDTYEDGKSVAILDSAGDLQQAVESYAESNDLEIRERDSVDGVTGMTLLREGRPSRFIRSIERSGGGWSLVIGSDASDVAEAVARLQHADRDKSEHHADEGADEASAPSEVVTGIDAALFISAEDLHLARRAEARSAPLKRLKSLRLEIGEDAEGLFLLSDLAGAGEDDRPGLERLVRGCVRWLLACAEAAEAEVLTSIEAEGSSVASSIRLSQDDFSRILKVIEQRRRSAQRIDRHRSGKGTPPEGRE